jgi:hypothetical protein
LTFFEKARDVDGSNRIGMLSLGYLSSDLSRYWEALTVFIGLIDVSYDNPDAVSL